MIGYIIIGCEIAFWLFVVAGLCVRYLLGVKKLGLALLMSTPIVDVLLLVATVMDLQRGATANFIHGIAAVYIGVSIAYGHQMIAWADRYFLHWFKGGPNPRSSKLYGKEHAHHERMGWIRHLFAWSISSMFLLIMIWWIGDAERTDVFYNLSRLWALIVGIDFLISFSYSLWPRKSPVKSVS